MLFQRATWRVEFGRVLSKKNMPASYSQTKNIYFWDIMAIWNHKIKPFLFITESIFSPIPQRPPAWSIYSHLLGSYGGGSSCRNSIIYCSFQLFYYSIFTSRFIRTYRDFQKHSEAVESCSLFFPYKTGGILAQPSDYFRIHQQSLLLSFLVVIQKLFLNKSNNFRSSREVYIKNGGLIL